MKVMILAGGFGTRLAHIVKDVPKPMAPVNGKPFLEILIGQLKKQGLEDIILLTGHKSEVIEGYFGGGAGMGVQIKYSVETSPLGTGGAILKAAEAFQPNEDFIVLNGDTYFDVDLLKLTEYHRKTGLSLTMALKYKEDTRRYGSVKLAGGLVEEFIEKKTELTDGFINGGIYVMNRSALEGFTGGAFSFESEVMPVLLKEKRICGVPFGGRFIDIGVPEDYHRANEVLEEWLAENKTPAVFLDRDGVINVDSGYTYRLSDLKLMSGVVPFLKELQAMGFKLVIVTNQAGIAKGKFKLEDYQRFQAALLDKLLGEGVRIEGTLYCPYHPSGVIEEYRKDSLLRKPAPGMLLCAAEIYGIDLTRSMMIGDKDSDRIDLPYIKSYILKGNYELKGNLRVYEGFPQILAEIKGVKDE